MITGANTNVRYRGVLFHVQTEDSGKANPHIISHLYHGGTILGSQKTEYREHLEADDFVEVIKAMIEEQHAAMVAQLHNGGFDQVIEERLGDTAIEPRSRQDRQPESKLDTQPEVQTGVPSPQARAGAFDKAVEERARAVAAKGPALRADRGFGEGLGSDKPLDEVILDYLCEKARDRGNGSSNPTRSGPDEG